MATFGAVEGILLDAVGTLIEPVPSVSAAYAAEAARQGVTIDPGEVRRRFLAELRDIEAAEPSLATDEANERDRWLRIVRAVLPGLPDPDLAFANLWDHFGRPSAWRCFDDVAAALRVWKRAGVPVRIASNFDGRLRLVAAGLPELAPLVDAAVISSEVGYRKPHPEFFRIGCERLGLAPDRVLCVGDDPRNDHEGAVGAGLRSVLVDRRGTLPAGLPTVPDLRALARHWDDSGDRVGSETGETRPAGR